MNKRFRGLFSRSRSKKTKNLAISIVILVEILSIFVVATFAWVETVSSIKITNEANTTGTVDNYVFTDVMIGKKEGTVDLGGYFKQAGDMHLAPCSSADGQTFYFPKAGVTNVYRKGNTSDKNTAYLSVSFRLRADTNADFFFEQAPTVSNYVRVSVTSQSEGSTSAPVTKIYANDASTTAVVSSTTGTTGATTVEKFSDHVKGKGSTARLFAVGANETKLVTVNVWLQKRTDSNADLTSNMSAAQTITNLAITSSLTPRHVTLLPTPTWDVSGITQYFYAWCWGATNGDASRLYKLSLDDKEHYSFDYNGTYQNTLFFRSGDGTLTTEKMNANNNANWSNGTIWNKTEDTSIPNDPVDPTYIIESIHGSSETDTSSGSNSTAKKSTGSWHDPAIVTVATCTDQSTWGSVGATSYRSTTVDASHIIEATNNDSQKHKNTVHAWPGKKIQLTAANASSNFAFVGWYDNPEGVIDVANGKHQLSTDATYATNAPSTAAEITYYAKFKQVRTITLAKRLDNVDSSSTACGTLYVDTHPSTSVASSTGGSASKTVDKDTNVKIWAVANSGYTLEGIFTTKTGTSPPSNTTVTEGGITKYVVQASNHATYYARFTTNSYNVTAHAYYSTDGGSTYTADSSTGGTVKAGSSSAGATSTASVKYKSSVNLVASPASGYEFDGWYSAASGGTKLSSDTTYSYTLSTTGAKNVYARFIGENWAIKYGVHGGSNWSTVNMTVSGNNVTGTMTLTEGQDFSFKITKTIGSTTTWYGGGGSYSGITSTSFISDLSMSTTGEDTYMKGHAGTYTFTYNKSTNKLNVTVSYSNITITFDYSAESWWGNDNAVISFYDGNGESNMSNVANQTKKTLSISSTRGNSGSVGFNRWNNSSHSTHWNNVDAGSRGYSTTYKMGSGWQ